MCNSSNKPSITSCLSCGYETNNGAPAPRQSYQQITPARRAPGMITPSADSDPGLFDGVRDVRDAHVHRPREQSASLPGNDPPGEPARGRSITVSRPSSSTTVSHSHSSLFR